MCLAFVDWHCVLVQRCFRPKTAKSSGFTRSSRNIDNGARKTRSPAKSASGWAGLALCRLKSCCAARHPLDEGRLCKLAEKQLLESLVEPLKTLSLRRIDRHGHA